MAFPRTPSSPATQSPNTTKTWRDYPANDPPKHLRLMNASERSHYKKIYHLPGMADNDFRDFMFGLGFYIAVEDRPLWPDLVPQPPRPEDQSVLANWPKPPPTQSHPVSQQTSTPTPSTEADLIPNDVLKTLHQRVAQIALAKSTPPQTPLQTPTQTPASTMPAVAPRANDPANTRRDQGIDRDTAQRRAAAETYTRPAGRPRVPAGNNKAPTRPTATDLKAKAKDRTDWSKYPQPTILAKDATPELAMSRQNFLRSHGLLQACARCVAANEVKTCDGTEYCSACKAAGCECQYAIAGDGHDLDTCTQFDKCTQIHDVYFEFLQYKYDNLDARDDWPLEWAWPRGVDRHAYYPSRDRVHPNMLPPLGVAKPYTKDNPHGHRTLYPQTWLVEAFRPNAFAKNQNYATAHRAYWTEQKGDVKIAPEPPKTDRRAADTPKEPRVRGKTYDLKEVPVEYQLLYDTVDDLRTQNPGLYEKICTAALRKANADAIEEAKKSGKRQTYLIPPQGHFDHNAKAGGETSVKAEVNDKPDAGTSAGGSKEAAYLAKAGELDYTDL